MKTRILFFFSALPVGGAERQSISLATELARRDRDCVVLCYHPVYSPAVITDEILARTTFVASGRMSSPHGTIRTWDAIARAAPDLILAVGTGPLRLAAWGRALRRYRASLVCTYHASVPTKADRIPGMLFRWSVPLADCLVYVSELQRQYWESRGHRCARIEVIHNGIDTTHFTAEAGDRDATRQKLGLAASDYVIGLVAAFRPEKNHLQLVDALAALRARGIPAKGLFVGDGRMRATTETYANTSGLAAHAVFVGEQHDVRPMIAAMDVGVLCSDAIETLSLAALESMAMGVPMVMSDIGGAREIVDEAVNGHLFPVRDTALLIDHLAALTDPSVRRSLGVAAAAKVRRTFTVERMVDRYDELITSLIEARDRVSRAVGRL